MAPTTPPEPQAPPETDARTTAEVMADRAELMADLGLSMDAEDDVHDEMQGVSAAELVEAGEQMFGACMRV